MPGKCTYCGTQLTGRSQKSPRFGTTDHLIPQWALRKSSVFMTEYQRHINKVPACRRCNERKGDMHPNRWLTLINDPQRQTAVQELLETLPVTLIYESIRNDGKY